MNAPTVRLFVAIDLDSRVRDAVAAEQRRIGRSAGHSLRFVKPDQLHLTLAFMAAVEQMRVPELTDAIAQRFAGDPFAIVLSGLGVLPPRGRPRVLYLHVASGAAAVVALQRTVAARLAGCGIALENRPFRPHLTLARWRDGQSADARRILASASNFRAEQEVASVVLYESRLFPDGPTHSALARGELRAT